MLAVAPLTLVARQSSLERMLERATPAERALRLSVRRPNVVEGGTPNVFADLLAVGADGRRPLPDLVPAFPWAAAMTVAATVAVIALITTSLLARRAFRGAVVGRLRG